jgi:HNH endonuclease/AP2 domain
MSYNPTTGDISRDGKIIITKWKTNRARCLQLTLDTSYKGCSLRYMTFHHHIAWYLTYRDWPTLIDHIDRDPTNNKLNNLRLATEGENSRNQRKCKKKTTSKYKGVSKGKGRKKWLVAITYQGETCKLGTYLDEKEAALAYNEAASRLHGEFAALNVIEDD